jgi:hypothetical protein
VEQRVGRRVTLGDVALSRTYLEVACARCGHMDHLIVAVMVDRYGSDVPLASLLRIVAAECPRMMERDDSDVCGARFSGLSGGLALYE